MKQTNCPNCGAVMTGPKCEYCGTVIKELSHKEHKEMHQINTADTSKDDVMLFAEKLHELVARSGMSMTPYIPDDETPMNRWRFHVGNDRVVPQYKVLLPIQEADNIFAEEEEGEWPNLNTVEVFEVSLQRKNMGKGFKKLKKKVRREERRKRRHARLLKVKSFFRRDKNEKAGKKRPL